jgi:hypothetical protein
VATATDAAPMAGFFAQGELGPIGGRNFLHTFTASMAVFCEPRDPVLALDRAASEQPPAPTEPYLGEGEATQPPPLPFQPPSAPETPEPV